MSFENPMGKFDEKGAVVEEKPIVGKFDEKGATVEEDAVMGEFDKKGAVVIDKNKKEAK